MSSPDESRLRVLTLRAWDLSDRATSRAIREQRRRVGRWHERVWLIVQCSLTAALSWWLCERLLGHRAPFFAPVASVICLGLSFGQRLTRALEVAVGVTVGVFVGEVFVHFFGAGVWQIALVCFTAMSIATWLGARNLMIIQAGLQSITVLLLFPGASQGVSRWLDAVVGCSLALVVTTFAPTSALVKPRLIAAEVLADVAATLQATRAALADGDEEAAHDVVTRARSASAKLDRLEQAAEEGMAVVRYSPFLRRHLPSQTALADLIGPLDKLTRDLRVVGRRATTATWRGETIPPEELALLGQLADVVAFCAGELYERRLPLAAVPRLVELGRVSARVEAGSDLSAAVILGQIRFMIVDLLQLAGQSYDDARELVPGMEG